MNPIIRTLIFIALVSQLHAGDSAARAHLSSAHERLRTLDLKLHDYRNNKAELPPAEEQERHRLLGQLMTDDPVWALAEQLRADISALAALRSRTPADDATLDSLKEFLAITSVIVERPATREQAEDVATALRQFIVRRDTAGASALAKSL